nr:uncharacterized protein LOC117225640 [Megalopta genalis]
MCIYTTKGNQPKITTFTSVYGVDTRNIELQNCVNIEDFYALLVTEEMLEEISEQTNIYATQKQSMMTSKRIERWIPTNKEEIKRLFGLIIWMGLIKYPADVTKRLWKIQPILDDLNKNFKKYYNPTFMKQKRHKYGIKIFKLCCGLGYTYNFRVYSGEVSDEVNTTPTNTVMNLCQDIFHKGHTVCTDNWYTSLTLAKHLLERNTHLMGTLRNNRKGNQLHAK